MIRKSKSSRRRISVKERLAGGFAALLLILTSYSASPHLPEVTYVYVPPIFQFKAAIVDELSLTCPNQTFVETATNFLEQAGFSVEYYRGEDVTVPFYKNLAVHGYGLIILRVHTAVGRGGYALSLFTSEPFDINKYPYQILTEQVTGVAYSMEDYEKGVKYFGINPNFITQSMRGRFWNTIIINMGCASGKSLITEAFIQKGAKVYIGWNDYVLASHTDLATTHLLRHFLIEKLTAKDSVQQTFKEVGADPAYKSLLLYYPLEAGEYVLNQSSSPKPKNGND